MFDCVFKLSDYSKTEDHVEEFIHNRMDMVKRYFLSIFKIVDNDLDIAVVLSVVDCRVINIYSF